MTRQRLLSIAVVVLVLLNAATLAVLLLRGPGDPRHPEHEGPKAIIIQRLRFDADQVKAYEELIRDHRRQMGDLDERMMDLRRQLYALGDGEKDSLIHLIATAQGEAERVNTEHFADIRSLCRSEQLTLFDQLTKDLADYFRHGPPSRKENR